MSVPGVSLVLVDKDHPCWKAYGDDDWNGATFWNWVHNVIVGQHVRLMPSPETPKETVDGVWEAVASTAGFVELEGVTMHILKFGVSHCGMPGVPGDWPPGNRWISFESPDLRAATTCEECRRLEGLGLPCRSADA
jgi:hypothetical protein